MNDVTVEQLVKALEMLRGAPASLKAAAYALCRREAQPFISPAAGPIFARDQDAETLEIITSLPVEGSDNEVYEQVKHPNAFVARDKFGRIGIYPLTGGWIGAASEVFVGDAGPFAG